MVRLWPWSLTGKTGQGAGRPGPDGLGESEVGCPGSLWLHLEQVPHGLCEAHSVHGHTHSVGKSKNEADGAPQLWAKTPGDEEVGATY